MFTVAGISKFNGDVKVRFSTNTNQAKTLERLGHTEINLVQLPFEMSKPLAIIHLMTTDLMNNLDYKAVLELANAKYSAEPVAKRKYTKKSNVATANKVGISGVHATVETAEGQTV